MALGPRDDLDSRQEYSDQLETRLAVSRLNNLIRSLVIPSYDSTTAEHAWINAAINHPSPLELPELAFKLLRAELKGSILYIYRPPSLLNVRQFRAEATGRNTDSPLPSALSQSSSVATVVGNPTHSRLPSAGRSLTVAGSLPSSQADTSSTSIMSFSMSSRIAPSNASQNPSNNQTAPSVASANTMVPSVLDASPHSNAIKYLDRQVPHPDLHLDSLSNTFMSNSSPEALVHHFLFSEAPSSQSQQTSDHVSHLIVVMPMLPNFKEILAVQFAMLEAIFDGKFGKFSSYKTFVDRCLALFDHIVKQFGGFLLKKTEGSLILKTLQLFDQHAPSNSASAIAFFKSSMLTKQQELLNLVNFDSFTTSQPPDPFYEISSSVFMNDVNLFELASLITELDLKFFKSWNSSNDKSLLLATLIADSSSSDTFFRKNPLVFNNDTQVHYLARLLIFHLFAEDTSNKTGERRARILERWIDLGCLLDKSGNMSSWLGIASIILSQPVLRLKSVWSYVSAEYIKLLRNDWSPVLFELDRRFLATTNENLDINKQGSVLHGEETGELLTSKESYHIMAPRGLGRIYSKDTVIPYFGDLLINNTSHGDLSNFETVWKKVNYSFDRWNDYLKNLTNISDLINYNQDVLRRYNSMGFIISNESLNQVLYLGVNKDEGALPSAASVPKNGASVMTSSETKDLLQKVLLRLLELNEESTSLSDVMACSLKLEPGLPEKYISVPDANANVSDIHKILTLNISSASLNSSSSGFSAFGNADLSESDIDSSLRTKNKETSPDEKLPRFNNQNFKIDLARYDDLVRSSVGTPEYLVEDSHKIVISNELTLRVDDFVPDFETSSLLTSEERLEEDEAINGDDQGLGIDVDDILNSDKFKNLLMAEESREEPLSPSKEKRHRSFGLISHSSNNRASLVRVSKYIPRFATLDVLIDLLLIDSSYFDVRYSIDLTEFRFVFLLNYTSFMTTKELLDSLAHRFVNSGNAVISIMKKRFLLKRGEFDPLMFGKFPNWDIDENVKLTDLGDVDYELLLKIQINILKVLLVLLNNFYTSFAYDLTNKRSMIKFFKLYTNEILQWYNSNKIDQNSDRYFEELVTCYKKLKKLFVKKTYRPIENLKFEEFLTHEFRFTNSLHDVPMNRNLPSHKNVHKIEKFIHKFNKLLTVFYKGINPEDWFKAFDLLENQLENFSLMNYTITKAASEEHVHISNIFTYFDSLRDASDNEFLIAKFPLVFRKLFQLYHKFKCYLYIQLCDPNISVEERLDRMKTLLIMVKISQMKMGDTQFVFEGNSGSIPSCIESAIVHVIYHPASRQLSSLWMKASNALNSSFQDGSHQSSYKDIRSLLPVNLKSSDMLLAHEPLLPCFGWIFELLLEVNKCPNFYRNRINFNKRYLIYKLIKELSVEDADDTHLEAGEFDFLLKLDESLCQSINVNDIMIQDRHKPSLFGPMVKAQLQINEAEAIKKEGRLARDATEDMTGVRSRRQANSTRRHSLNYKTNATSRFKISGLFNRLNNAGNERVVDYRELPDVSSVADLKSKPLHTIYLKDYQIFPVYLLTYCLKLTSETGDVVYLKAPTEDAMRGWSSKLAFANRHWFFSKTLNNKWASPTTTFNIPLETVCSRDREKAPVLLNSIYAAIEKEGLNDVGIYRISTSLSELTALRQEIDRTGTIDFEARHIDVHALTSCVKLFFRELPDPILTDDVIRDLYQLKTDNDLLTDAMSEEDFFAEPFAAMLKKLPHYNYYTIKALTGHLHRITCHSDKNKMTASNLATVIGPALTEASSAESLVSNFGFINFVMEKLICHWTLIFNYVENE